MSDKTKKPFKLSDNIRRHVNTYIVGDKVVGEREALQIQTPWGWQSLDKVEDVSRYSNVEYLMSWGYLTEDQLTEAGKELLAKEKADKEDDEDEDED